MKDLLTNDYHTLGLPNVIIGVNKSGSDFRSSILPDLLTLATSVALKRPRWEFIFYAAEQFIVEEDSVELGKVGFSKTWSSKLGSHYAYTIGSHRISKSMRRGRTKQTANAKLAGRHIREWFGAETPEEIIDGIGDPSYHLRRVSMEARHMVERKESTLFSHLRPYIEENWEEIKKAAYKAGSFSGTLDDLPELKGNQVELADMMNEVEAGRAKVIVPYKEGYLMKWISEDAVQVITKDSEALTPQDQTYLGMLKLVEPEKCIHGVGLKTGKGVFLILTREEK